MLLVEAEDNGDLAAQDLSDLKLDMLRSLALNLLKQVESLAGGRVWEYGGDFSFYEEVRRFETALIRNALLRTGGHQARAARLLGLKNTTLNSIMKRYDIQPSFTLVPDGDQPASGAATELRG